MSNQVDPRLEKAINAGKEKQKQDKQALHETLIKWANNDLFDLIKDYTAHGRSRLNITDRAMSAISLRHGADTKDILNFLYTYIRDNIPGIDIKRYSHRDRLTIDYLEIQWKIK